MNKYTNLDLHQIVNSHNIAIDDNVDEIANLLWNLFEIIYFWTYDKIKIVFIKWLTAVSDETYDNRNKWCATVKLLNGYKIGKRLTHIWIGMMTITNQAISTKNIQRPSIGAWWIGYKVNQIIKVFSHDSSQKLFENPWERIWNNQHTKLNQSRDPNSDI